MRIWMINHYALPPTSAGGTRHYNFAKQLQLRGHEVIIIASDYNHFSQTYIPTSGIPGEKDESYEVPFVWVPSPAYRGNTLSRFYNMLAFSFRILRKKYLPMQEPPDVIIGSSPHLFAAFSAERLARRFKVPFLLEVRDLWPESLVDLGRFTNRHPLIKLMKRIEMYLYKRARRIISLLPAADKYLTECGVDPAHIMWLPNAIDTDNVPINLERLVQPKFTFMYAGAHGLANDLDCVLDAAKILQQRKLLKPIRICLIGDGPEKKRLQERAANENITMVEFLDSVNKTKIYQVLNQADAFLMLLKNSPVFKRGISPNKLFDYLLMERPIIFGVNTPFNPIDQYQAGITIEPSDADALADAMHTMSILPEDELKQMGARGRNFVLEKHHVRHLTDSLEKMIHEVA